MFFGNTDEALFVYLEYISNSKYRRDKHLIIESDMRTSCNGMRARHMKSLKFPTVTCLFLEVDVIISKWLALVIINCLLDDEIVSLTIKTQGIIIVRFFYFFL